MGNLTEKMRMIPERMIKCLDYMGFINEVKNRMDGRKSLIQAYNEVEDDMEKYFGFRKFSDISSFRVIMSRKSRRKNKITSEQAKKN